MSGDVTDFRLERPVVLVNPNEGRPWKCAVWHDSKNVRLEFEPFRRLRLPESMANLILTEASQAKRAAAIQAQRELDQYSILANSGDLSREHVAKDKFINKAGRDYPGDNKPPRTREWTFDPVVNLSTPAGLKSFETAVEMYGRDKDLFDDDEVVREREDVRLPKLGAHENLDWGKMAIYQWILDEGGMASTTQDIDALYDRAFRLIKRQFDWLAKRDITMWDTEFDCSVRMNADGDRIVWPEQAINKALEQKKTADLTG